MHWHRTFPTQPSPVGCPHLNSAEALQTLNNHHELSGTDILQNISFDTNEYNFFSGAHGTFLQNRPYCSPHSKSEKVLKSLCESLHSVCVCVCTRPRSWTQGLFPTELHPWHSQLGGRILLSCEGLSSSGGWPRASNPLPQPPHFWDYKHTPLIPAISYILSDHNGIK